MNAEPSLASELSLHFSPEPRTNPVVIGQPIRYASRVAKIVSIKETHAISDRVSWSDVEVTPIGGECAVTFAGATVTLQAKESVTIPAMVEHTIEAISDSRLVVSFKRS